MESSASSWSASDRCGQPWTAGCRLGEVIGTGGTAAVYASVLPDGSDVAVKVMHPQWADDSAVVASFESEAALLEALQSPALPMFRGRGRLPGTGEPYVVMERLTGALVSEVLARNKGQLAPTDAFHIITGVLDGLAVLHASGVVHRDIKPSNLFIQTDGHLKLLDLGAAMLLDRVHLMPTDRLVGSPSYMAPEQAVNATLGVDCRSDVFAVGATLFHMLTGRPVRQAPSVDELFRMAASVPAPSIAEVIADLPTPIIQVIDRALAWVPADRYPDATELLSALFDAADRGELPPSPLALAGSQALQIALGFGADEEASAALDDRGRIQSHLRDLFRRMSRTVLAHRQFKMDSDELRQRYAPVHEVLPGIFREVGGSLDITVKPNSFFWQDLPVWEPELGLEDIPYYLFQSGFRGFRFHPEIEDHEVIRFLKLMSIDPMRDLPQEDDLSTVYFDFKFVYIEADILSGFDVDILDKYESFGQQSQQLLSEVDREAKNNASSSGMANLSAALGGRGRNEADAMQLNVELRPSDEHRAVTGTPWDKPLTGLAASSESDAGRWLERGSRMLAVTAVQAQADDQLSIVVDRLTERLQLLAQTAALADALPLMAGICATAPRAIGQELMARVLVDDLAERLIHTATLPRPQFDNRPFAAERAFIPLLRMMPAATSNALLEQWVRHASDELSGVFANEVIRRVSSSPELVTERIASLPEELALALLRSLVELDVERIRPVFMAALESPSEQVQTFALSLLIHLAPAAMQERLRSLLKSSESRSRRSAISLIEQHKATFMADTVVELCRQPRFHELPLAERQAMLVLIHTLNPGMCRPLLEMLVQPSGFGNDTQVSPSRILAADVLATLFPDATTASILEKEAKRLLRTPANVRDRLNSIIARLRRAHAGAS